MRRKSFDIVGGMKYEKNVLDNFSLHCLKQQLIPTPNTPTHAYVRRREVNKHCLD